MFKALIPLLFASALFAADAPKVVPKVAPKLDAELRATYWRLQSKRISLQTQINDTDKENQPVIDKMVKECGDEFQVVLDNTTQDLICGPKSPKPEVPKTEEKK